MAVTPKKPITLSPIKTEEKLETASQLVGLYCQPVTRLVVTSPVQPTTVLLVTTPVPQVENTLHILSASSKPFTELMQSTSRAATEETCNTSSALSPAILPMNTVSLSSPNTAWNENLSLKPAKEAVLDAMKAQFYKLYSVQSTEGSGSSVASSSILITKKKYDELVVAFQNCNAGKKKDQFMKNTKNHFSLGTNLQDNNLYRKNHTKTEEGGTTSVEETLKKVICYESFIEVIHETHISLLHSACSRTHTVASDKQWWGSLENAIKIYISLCPECVSTQKQPASEGLHPLKMMISITIGKHVQMDLIDYQSQESLGYHWILCLVDHHSGFAHVAPLRRKTEKKTGRVLVRILSTSCIPKVLQSDNDGSKFLGKMHLLCRIIFQISSYPEGETMATK
jgi:hypothetical protein